MFPGGHIGFAEDPARFQARVREVVESWLMAARSRRAAINNA